MENMPNEKGDFGMSGQWHSDGTRKDPTSEQAMKNIWDQSDGYTKRYEEKRTFYDRKLRVVREVILRVDENGKESVQTIIIKRNKY